MSALLVLLTRRLLRRLLFLLILVFWAILLGHGKLLQRCVRIAHRKSGKQRARQVSLPSQHGHAKTPVEAIKLQALNATDRTGAMQTATVTLPVQPLVRTLSRSRLI